MSKRRCLRKRLVCGLLPLLFASVAQPSLAQPPTQYTAEYVSARRAKYQTAMQQLLAMNAGRFTRVLFPDDKGLSQPMTLAPRLHRGNSLLSRMERASKRQIGTEDGEPLQGYLWVACDGTSVRAVMEAWAALYENRWERVRPKQYRLMQPLSSEASLFFADDETEETVFALGADFFKGFDQLPQEVQEQFLGTNDSDIYVSAGLLPAGLQKLLGRMITETHEHNTKVSQEAARREGATVHSPPLPTDQMADWKIKFTPTARSSYREYDIYAQYPGCSMMFRVNIPFTSDTGGGEIGSDGKAKPTRKATIYVPPDEKTASAQENPALGRVVTLEADDATFTDALRLLHETTKLPLLTTLDTSPEKQTRKHDIRLKNVTVEDALKQIATLYATDKMRIVMESCEGGFVVLTSAPPH